MSKEQEKLRKRLSALLKLPENRFCCECGQKQPQWASTNLGVFFCIRCSGIHRALGVHISTVRSTTLDNWKSEWVDNMEKWGNARGNEYWEAGNPGSRKPHENVNDHVLDQFIRDKYVRGVWKAKSSPSFESDNNETQPKQTSIQVKPAVAVAAHKPHVAAQHSHPKHAHPQHNHQQHSHQHHSHSKHAHTTKAVHDHQNNTNVGDDFAAFFDDVPTDSQPSTSSAMFSLDNFFSNSDSSPSQPTNNAMQQQQQQQQQAQPTTSNPAAAPKKPTTTSDIMSLFSNPNPVPAPAPATMAHNHSAYYAQQNVYQQQQSSYPMQSGYPPQGYQQPGYGQPSYPPQQVNYQQQPMYYSQPIYAQPMYGQPTYPTYPTQQYNNQMHYNNHPGNMYNNVAQPHPQGHLQKVSTTEKDPFADLF